jgi:hypothetical protein
MPRVAGASGTSWSTTAAATPAAHAVNTASTRQPPPATSAHDAKAAHSAIKVM